MSVPSRSDYFDRWSALHGGVNPSDSTFIKGWLTLIYFAARPFALAGVHPDALTLAGAVVAGFVVGLTSLGGRWLIAAAVVVAVSGVFDSLDGAVAIMMGRSSRWGALLDSLVDRVSDLLYLVALGLAGAPTWLCVAAGSAMFMLEYSRARALAIGMNDVGIISIGERPTRVTVTAMFLLAAGIYPSDCQLWATLGAAGLLVIGLVGLLQFLWVARDRLRR